MSRPRRNPTRLYRLQGRERARQGARLADPAEDHPQRADQADAQERATAPTTPTTTNSPDAFSGQDYWPEALGRQKLYDPVERGFEREIRKRLEYWEKLRKERGG